jgi:hypothetical protein
MYIVLEGTSPGGFGAASPSSMYTMYTVSTNPGGFAAASPSSWPTAYMKVRAALSSSLVLSGPS